MPADDHDDVRNEPRADQEQDADEAVRDDARRGDDSSNRSDGDAAAQARDANPRRIKRRRHRRPSPAAVLARVVDAPPAAEQMARILARALGPLGEHAPQERAADAAHAAADFWDVWLAHRDYLHRHCVRFSNGNLADAEDAMSEAMIKAAQAFPQAEIRNHRAWLLRLVHNACMDRYRKSQRQKRLVLDMTNDDGQSVPAAAPKHNRTPEELLAALQLVDGLQQALAALPQFLAEPLQLYLDDQSDAEIAGSLNVSREVVRKRRQMARDWLRRQLRI